MGTEQQAEGIPAEDAEELAFEAYQEERLYRKYVDLYGDWSMTRDEELAETKALLKQNPNHLFLHEYVRILSRGDHE